MEAQISENIAALCRRAGTNQTRLAGEVGLTVASMSRKMAGGPWHYAEVVAIAELLGVTPEELAGTIPDRETWRARRDSNPKPSDLYLVSDNTRGRPFQRGQDPDRPRPRHLTAV